MKYTWAVIPVVCFVLAFAPTSIGCKTWFVVQDAAVDCAKETGRDIWPTELDHLREMIGAGVSYESVVSYVAGLTFRFGKPFVICLWQRVKAEPGKFAAGSAQTRAGLYADRWLAENQ